LEGVEIAELGEQIVNKFNPPRLGSDDPHQGVDLADIDPTYRITLEGLTVQAVTDGIVAGVIEDRFPYGHAILIETTFNQIPDRWLSSIPIPTLAPPRTGHPSLTCPELENPPELDLSKRSLYLIYAHLKDPTDLQVGDAVTCGQPLNAIGNSGNSINPHLHLEMRVGPSGSTFSSLAHYTGSASPEEMYNYCLWRVSETFQLMDPMQLFNLTLNLP
jgi:murein DD-endopeptidase MepM/ murein hydrolase activator NlpD